MLGGSAVGVALSAPRGSRLGFAVRCVTIALRLGSHERGFVLVQKVAKVEDKVFGR